MSMNQPTFCVPKILFGNAEDTMAEWTALVNIAKSNFPLFQSKLDSLELVNILPRSEKIILKDLNDGCQKATSYWRLNYVSGVFVKWWKSYRQIDLTCEYGPFRISPEFESLSSASMLQQQIVILGLRYSWFVVGMLDPEHNSPGFSFPGTHAKELFFLPILRRLINCLPEFMTVLPKLHYGLGNSLMPYDDVDNPNNWWYVWSYLLKLIEIYRPSVRFDEMREIVIPITYKGNLIEALLGEDIIRRSEGRYFLNE